VETVHDRRLAPEGERPAKTIEAIRARQIASK
jgi:hypothetical protein